ncbi:Hypothetical protein MVR_LOCUS138 [uncultured virus]|nr:Hypothetical protein MVR_LOCUS138 [uncultured virus]
MVGLVGSVLELSLPIVILIMFHIVAANVAVLMTPETDAKTDAAQVKATQADATQAHTTPTPP